MAIQIYAPFLPRGKEAQNLTHLCHSDGLVGRFSEFE
jgi:hypothetical protein